MVSRRHALFKQLQIFHQLMVNTLQLSRFLSELGATIVGTAQLVSPHVLLALENLIGVGKLAAHTLVSAGSGPEGLDLFLEL